MLNAAWIELLEPPSSTVAVPWPLNPDPNADALGALEEAERWVVAQYVKGGLLHLLKYPQVSLLLATPSQVPFLLNPLTAYPTNCLSL